MSGNGVQVSVDVDLSEFNYLIKNINETVYAEVGVLGRKTSKKKDDKSVSVVDYAIAHEFGVVEHNLPRRSFIKDPLEAHLKEGINEVKGSIGKMLERGRVDKAVDIMGMKAVEIIKKAFETENDGKWAPLSPVTVAAMKPSRKKGYKILQDTTDLLTSISSKVVKE